MWLAPKFHDFVPATPPIEVDDLAVASASLTQSLVREIDDRPSVSMFMVHMHQKNHRMMLTSNILAAAWQIVRPRMSSNRIAARWEGKIAGLRQMMKVQPGELAFLHRTAHAGDARLRPVDNAFQRGEQILLCAARGTDINAVYGWRWR